MARYGDDPNIIHETNDERRMEEGYVKTPELEILGPLTPMSLTEQEYFRKADAWKKNQAKLNKEMIKANLFGEKK